MYYEELYPLVFALSGLAGAGRNPKEPRGDRSRDPIRDNPVTFPDAAIVANHEGCPPKQNDPFAATAVEPYEFVRTKTPAGAYAAPAGPLVRVSEASMRG